MRRHLGRRAACATAAVCLGLGAAAQPPPTYRSAVIALTADPELRAELEQGLVEKARQHDYDAVTSFDIIPEARRLDDRGVTRRLAAEGIQAVLMMRPAAAGPGATLASIQDDVSPETYADIRKFAREVSPTDGEEVVAIVHMAIYVLVGERAELVSSGAVWLNEEPASREQALDRLQDLIVANVDLVRPQVREHLGLPPLE
ncbi:MAG TPA: hypothetical protein VF322_09360 [Gammaproteobacteria bacterium]